MNCTLQALLISLASRCDCLDARNTVRNLAFLQLAVLAIACAMAAPVEAATRNDAPIVGEASTIVSLVTGTLGGEPREIAIRDNVFSQEVIESGPEAAAKLVFRDGSEFVMGANSRVTLDRFVYDAETGTGQLVMNMLSGVFEFASGLMRPSSYDLRTPFATLAIRGTRLVVDVNRQFVFVRSANSSGTRSAVDIRLRDGQTVSRGIEQGLLVDAQGVVQLCEKDACLPPPPGDPSTLPESELDYQVIDIPVAAPRLVEAAANRPMMVVFGDFSQLALYSGAKARIERYSYDREKRSGGLAVTVLAGGFNFKSGKMPSSSYQVETAYGEVSFHGTCTYGSAEGFFVLRCSDLVTVTYKDGQVQQLAEGQGVTFANGLLTSCADAACNANLDALSLALQRLAQAETSPATVVPIRATIERIIQTLPSPDQQTTQSSP
jgi:hypothetical protein